MHRYLVPVLITAMTAAITAPVAAAVETTTSQLPRSVRPSHYELAIEPDVQALRFNGKVAIDLEVLQATDRIILNALDLSIAEASLAGSDGAPVAVATVLTDAAAQTATFKFARPVVPGRYRLNIDYSGKIATQAAGLFALDYDTDHGRKWALYTQFESADARRLLPSWDEPAYKASFRLEATVPSGATAVGNMPVEQRSDLGQGRTRVRFAVTPKMSTYLLFFGLGEFDRAAATVGETEVGVITRQGGSAQAAFALESAQRILADYNDYFGTPYPLPKLDNIAAPGRSQFFSAMENWGSIFTFEHSILLDPAISTQADKQRAFSIAAHEIAHQWFGDLVTMSWWEDLWLNESFASWMDSRTTARLHPEWKTLLRAVGSREYAMDLDALKTSHAVVQHVATVDQAAQAFDAITYQKGEAVIRMLEAYVGAEAWRDGVRRYMREHAYGNTVSADLWRALEAAAGKPIGAIARDFTEQPGVPLLVVEDVACTDGNTRVRLRQREFSKDQPNKPALAWRLPVIAQSGGTSVTALVEGRAARLLTVPGCGPLIVNAGQSGYYRTLYGKKGLLRIVGAFAELAPIDQLGILSDSWALGLAGLQSPAGFLDLVQATPLQADPQVWGKIASLLRSLDEYYRGDSSRQAALRGFAIARLTPVFERLGWVPKPDEADDVAILRLELIDTLGALGAPDIIAEARRRYANRDKEPAGLPGSLRKSILAVVARHADAATWDQLHSDALAEKTPLIKDLLYTLLSSSEAPTLARRALDLSLTPEPGATSSAAMISAVARRHPDMAFDFALANLAAVKDKIDASSHSRYFPRLAEGSLDPAIIDKLSAYAKTHLAASSRRATDTALAKIAYRIGVRNKRLAAIDRWLAEHRQPALRTASNLGRR